VLAFVDDLNEKAAEIIILIRTLCFLPSSAMMQELLRLHKLKEIKFFPRGLITSLGCMKKRLKPLVEDKNDIYVNKAIERLREDLSQTSAAYEMQAIASDCKRQQLLNLGDAKDYTWFSSIFLTGKRIGHRG